MMVFYGTTPGPLCVCVCMHSCVCTSTCVCMCVRARACVWCMVQNVMFYDDFLWWCPRSVLCAWMCLCMHMCVCVYMCNFSQHALTLGFVFQCCSISPKPHILIGHFFAVALYAIYSVVKSERVWGLHRAIYRSTMIFSSALAVLLPLVWTEVKSLLLWLVDVTVAAVGAYN